MKIDKYWKKAEIDGLISFPILEFEMNGNGLINYYKSIDDIIGKWNHYMVEPIVKNELPDYLIDSNCLKLYLMKN